MSRARSMRIFLVERTKMAEHLLRAWLIKPTRFVLPPLPIMGRGSEKAQALRCLAFELVNVSVLEALARRPASPDRLAPTIREVFFDHQSPEN